MRTNRVRAKLERGELVLGVNVQIDSPWLVELMGVAGFDFALLDGEHGAAFNNLPALIMAADAGGITPIVRPPSHDRGFLLPPLEAGAGGLQVTMVNTPDEARRLVHETKYAPVGGRGFSNATRAAGYGAAAMETYAADANRETLLIAQIETGAALANIDAIADVEGIDILFFGPGDLSQSLGYFGHQAAEPVRAAIRRAVDIVGERAFVSTSAFSRADVEYWIQTGVRCFLTSSMHPIRLTFERLHDALRGP
jgi:4-hydroxy-2-oxoheptanedioate aldolase